MSDFAVRIEGGCATAIHHTSGHVFEFSIAPEPPYLRGGMVRENQKADRGPDSLWGAARRRSLRSASCRPDPEIEKPRQSGRGRASLGISSSIPPAIRNDIADSKATAY